MCKAAKTTKTANWEDAIQLFVDSKGNQGRVKSFFEFRFDAAIILTNPSRQLSTIQIKADEASNVRPFEPKEYKAVFAAISKSDLMLRNQARVKVCMQLQRWLAFLLWMQCVCPRMSC